MPNMKRVYCLHSSLGGGFGSDGAWQYATPPFYSLQALYAVAHMPMQ